jgi:tetratricopeptide (TPR) repeat protein
MPYIPKFRHLAKIVLRLRDEQAAEGLWFEGLWLSERGDDEGARQAFLHACLLDGKFGGAYYNYAALTEKTRGKCPETIKAWKRYLKVAAKDPRQHREVISKVAIHLKDLEGKSGP